MTLREINIYVRCFAVILLSTFILSINVNAQYSASIDLHGEKTDVYLGEDILLKLSIVNLISNPKINAQIIIIPPSGMSVTSTEFSKVAAGQYVANYELNPGDGREIEVKIRPNQVGEFNIKGRVIYYFGDEKDKSQSYETDLPIKVRKETVLSPKYTRQKGLLGFEIVLIGIGMIAIVIVISIIIIRLLKK